jgi:uncharacterized LabA/DUF88 family protein
VKTIVYIDGYNLYYGRLKYSEYKWLDLYRLFSEQIVKTQSPQAIVTKVKYFTADIKAKVATHGQAAQHAQNNYHRALETLYPGKVEVIKGFYSLDYAKLPRYKQPPDKTDRVEVWRLEEKQTDVNIALHAYRDAIRQECEQIVLVSNDTDLEPALQIIRADVGDSVDIGIVIPIAKPAPGKAHRPPNQRLSQYANWTRRYILDSELESSQLPNPIGTKKKPILRPDYW